MIRMIFNIINIIFISTWNSEECEGDDGKQSCVPTKVVAEPGDGGGDGDDGDDGGGDGGDGDDGGSDDGGDDGNLW